MHRIFAKEGREKERKKQRKRAKRKSDSKHIFKCTYSIMSYLYMRQQGEGVNSCVSVQLLVLPLLTQKLQKSEKKRSVINSINYMNCNVYIYICLQERKLLFIYLYI